MFKRILVPLDSSTLAENALAPAIALAKETGGEILLVRAVYVAPVIPMDPMGGGEYMWIDDTVPALVENATTYLKTIVAREAQPTFSLRTRVTRSEPASGIIDIASEESIDLIVMSTHGYSGLSRWVFGSVTERVLRHAPCPVYVLRSAEIPSNILIPLDGSPLAETIIEPAISIAKSVNATITITRIDDPKARPNEELYTAISQHDKALAETYKEQFYYRSLDYLAQIKEKYTDRGVPIKCDIGQGNPAERIIGVADRNECDLIAMSTHGRTGIQRWRYGSVTERVLRNTNKAMLIARPTDEAFNTLRLETNDIETHRPAVE